jgi:hypothetical protein
MIEFVLFLSIYREGSCDQFVDSPASGDDETPEKQCAIYGNLRRGW